MSTNSNSSSSGGVGCTTLFTAIFVVLKLVGVIDWSWWWVLSPIWISLGLVVVLFLVVGIITVLRN